MENQSGISLTVLPSQKEVLAVIKAVDKAKDLLDKSQLGVTEARERLLAAQDAAKDVLGRAGLLSVGEVA